MKDPNHAPMYAATYPRLCEIARSMGYALAIHGSLGSDFDLIAVPWIDEVATPKDLVYAIRDHLGGYVLDSELVRAEARSPEAKPHGRQSWSIHWQMSGLAYIDLSVITPRN